MTIGAALYQRTCWLRFTLRVAEPTFDKDLNVVGAHDHAPNRWSSTSHCADIDCYGAGAPPVYFGGGGKLASDLTWPRLLRRWDGSAAPAGAQVGPAVSAARRAASTARWEPGVRPVRTDRFGLTEMERLRIWKQSTLAASRASEHIAASVEGDPAGAADAAWAASDFLAATGRVVEDRRGGPLTEAAQSCDQAARELHGKVPALTAAGTGLRAAGRLLLSAQVAQPSESKQLFALMAQLAALTDAVTRLRKAQDRAGPPSRGAGAVDVGRKPDGRTVPQTRRGQVSYVRRRDPRADRNG